MYSILVQQRTGNILVTDTIKATIDTVSEYTVYGLGKTTLWSLKALILCLILIAAYTPYTVIITTLNTNDVQGPPASLDFFSSEGSKYLQ